MLFRAMAIPRQRLARALLASTAAIPCDGWRTPAAAVYPDGTTRPVAPRQRPRDGRQSAGRGTAGARCPRRPGGCAAPPVGPAARPVPGPLPCIPGSTRPAGARPNRHTRRAFPTGRGLARCREGRGGPARHPRSAPTPPPWGCERRSDRIVGRRSVAVSPPAGSPSWTRSWSRTRSRLAAQPPPSREHDGCRHELDGIANQERVKAEVEYLRRRNEMGQPEQPEEVDGDLAGDHGDDRARQVFRPAQIRKPADDEGGGYKASQISITRGARRRGKHGKANCTFRDV